MAVGIVFLIIYQPFNLKKFPLTKEVELMNSSVPFPQLDLYEKMKSLGSGLNLGRMFNGFNQRVQSVPKRSTQYAVYSCSTPSGGDEREYDYVFYLPLTALAWQRLGFKNLILIIGTREEWTSNFILNYVLNVLESERHAEIMFIDAPPVSRIFISQTSRLFVSHMDQFRGKSDDILLTSDSDIWPLRRAHFDPDEPYDLLLLNSGRAGKFQHENRTYNMQAISCIAASVETWKQLVPHAPMEGNYTEHILSFLEERFGSNVRQKVILDSPEWYIDQKLISLNIYDWIEKHPQKKVVRMIEDGFFRVDRINWDGDWINREEFEESVDSHLFYSGYQLPNWNKIQPLLNLMYGNDTWQTKWCDEYRNRFFDLYQKKSWTAC